MEYTDEQLEGFLKDAYSYNGRYGFGVEELETELVGTLRRGDELTDIYVDTQSNYWYKTRYETEYGIISHFEKIFGYPEPQGYAGGRRARHGRGRRRR